MCRDVISAYLTGKRRDFVHVCIILKFVSRDNKDNDTMESSILSSTPPQQVQIHDYDRHFQGAKFLTMIVVIIWHLSQ